MWVGKPQRQFKFFHSQEGNLCGHAATAIGQDADQRTHISNCGQPHCRGQPRDIGYCGQPHGTCRTAILTKNSCGRAACISHEFLPKERMQWRAQAA